MTKNKKPLFDLEKWESLLDILTSPKVSEDKMRAWILDDKSVMVNQIKSIESFINSSIRKAQCEAVMEVLGSLNFDDDADMGNNRIEANRIRAKYQEGK